MPMMIVRNDITHMEVDAIVNATDEQLSGNGGVDRSIHRAAGKSLDEQCKALGSCKVGEAKATLAGRLPCKYVIHTVGPIWKSDEREKLLLCYKNAMELAAHLDCETVAFPLISSGTFGCPKEYALKIAIQAISDFLQDHEMTIYIVVYDQTAYCISRDLYPDILQFIDDSYVEENPHFDNRIAPMYAALQAPAPEFEIEMDEMCACAPPNLEDALEHVDESFSQMLLRKIDESGMTDVQCYKRANVNRRLFSKIRSDEMYRPSKSTAIAFAIALKLPMDEVRELLMKAGFALSHSIKADIIIEFFIQRGNYDIIEINEALFTFGQNLLGA